jgi:hypothetical protein
MGVVAFSLVRELESHSRDVPATGPAPTACRQRSKAVQRGAVRVPQGLWIVTSQWVSQSIIRRGRQQEEDYLPTALQSQPATQAAAGLAAEQVQQQQQQASRADSTVTVAFTPRQLEEVMCDVSSQTRPAEPPGAAAGMGNALLPSRTAGRPAATTACALPAATTAATAAPAAAAVGEGGGGRCCSREAARESARLEAEQSGECSVERRGAEFVCARGAKPRFTGGSTGLPWGAHGVWDEPVDVQAARWAPHDPLLPACLFSFAFPSGLAWPV